MFSKLFVAALVLASGASARMSAVRRSNVPSGYYEGYLENYDAYHTRYVDLDCKHKHGTTFFDNCCHPMLSTETLAANRLPECNPANVKSTTSSAAAQPTATDDDDGEECEEGEEDCVCTYETESTTTTTQPKTTAKAAPTTTKAKATTKTTTTKSTPKSTPASTSSDVKTGGVATYFYQNGNAGACGSYHQDDDHIAAIDSAIYGSSGSTSSHCGKQIEITRKSNGKKVTVTVADECPSCINANSIDLSVGAFKAIATEEEGQVDITWVWL